MTPTLQALARAYMALPGAPTRDEFASELLVEDRDGRARFRDRGGILWTTDLADRMAPWLPDLTDPATGGCMLDLLPVTVEVYRRAPGRYRLAYDLSPIDRRWTNTTATLAEAVARVAVAVGRAG